MSCGGWMRKTTKEYFMKRVRKGRTCWTWMAYRDTHGYGKIRYRGKVWRAHRLSYHFFKGPIKKGLFICHTCDNPSCVNPDHLWQGTAKDNARDRNSKMRHSYNKTDTASCGHKYDLIDSKGYRICLRCRRAISRNSARRMYEKRAKEAKRLKEQNAKMKSTLEFYADKDHWFKNVKLKNRGFILVDEQDHEPNGRKDVVGGKMARDALKEVSNDEV